MTWGEKEVTTLAGGSYLKIFKCVCVWGGPARKRAQEYGRKDLADLPKLALGFGFLHPGFLIQIYNRLLGHGEATAFLSYIFAFKKCSNRKSEMIYS